MGRVRGRADYPPALVGDLTVDYESFVLAGDPDTMLYVYTTAPGTRLSRSEPEA
ncbi:hypothetical protein SK854_05750 [Lentzea sp. BCCO 10_0061]|uniref:Uncharacterized protein n=1 Tax=Lentzea sokolovensis TaxID=3095429 RepID=A0ABU4UQ46_9PSEU|nr:hypothetical protein [Lentzea sp. BCCO 10_0061]MDX8141607.1 hypothetical protein [Lentzea sp. BCCO 10_0061]